MAGELRFERFDKSRHRREGFDCGVRALNDYLKTTLNQQMQRGVTVGYVLTGGEGGGGGEIAGYFTLSSGRLEVSVVPEGHGFPVRMPLPTTLLGRLAVDLRFRSRGLGGMLLVHALRLAVEAAKTVASAVIEVGAKDEPARAFYGKYGFKSLRDDPMHMYLPMADARLLVASLDRE